MRRGTLTLLATVTTLVSSTAIGDEPSLDLRLAVAIYDAQQSQVDRLVEAGVTKDRILAVRSCFEALRRGDTDAARDQLGAAQHSNAEAPPILPELESVAGAVLALYLADDNKARELLARLPEKNATKPHGLLPPFGNLREETLGDPSANANAAAVSYNNHLRARLLYLAGNLNAAYALVHQVVLEQRDRLGTSHPDTWDASIDLVEYGLPIVGGETLYDFSTTLIRQSASGVEPSVKDRIVATHAEVLRATGRHKQAIELCESRLLNSPQMDGAFSVRTLTTLARCYVASQDSERAVEYARDACEMAQNLQPQNRFLACRALCTLASAQLAANYGRAEVKATTDSLVASLRKTDRDTVLGVECDMLRASIADRNGKEKVAYRHILAPLKRSRALGRHGLELDLALELSTYFFAHDRIAGATALYEHFLPTPAERLSPHLSKHTLLYATCRKRTGEWKKCLAVLSPNQDEWIDLENTVDIGMAVLHAEAVGRCGDWPESVRLSRSIVQQLSSREAPVKDGGQWASQLLFAYQGLVDALIENGELDVANKALRASEKIAAKTHGRTSPWRLGIVRKQGDIAMRQQQYTEAAELFGQIADETADHENATDFHEHARSRRDEAIRLAEATEADSTAPDVAR